MGRQRDVVIWAVGVACGVGALLGIERRETLRDAGNLSHGPSREAPEERSGSPPDTKSAPTEGEAHAWQAANANLAEQVRDTKTRLERNEAERRDLTKALARAQRRLDAVEGGGARQRNEFDLTADDWKALAKSGTVKARFPCDINNDWSMSAEKAQAMGLAPDDARAVEAAMKHAGKRIWDSVAPGCAAVVGSNELAEKLGTNVCITIVSEATKDGSADIQLVADVRAGNRPLPTASKLDAYATVLLAETDAMPGIVGELSQTLGRDKAKRIAFDDELGSCSGSVGGTPSVAP